MTLSELFAYVNGVRPSNAFDNDTKTVWINEIEGRVQTDILEIDSEDQIEYDYDTDSEKELLVPKPFYKLYRYYLIAMIDQANGEMTNYQNTLAAFNRAWYEYERYAASQNDAEVDT